MARSENVQEPFDYSVRIVMFQNTDPLFPDDEKPPSEKELERAIHHGLGDQYQIDPAQVVVTASFDTAFQLGELNK